jgi:hypothetical protein
MRFYLLRAVDDHRHRDICGNPDSGVSGAALRDGSFSASHQKAATTRGFW